MPRDADRIVSGFGALSEGLGRFGQQMREDEEKRLGRAEKMHQELRPLPPEQANIYQQLSSSGMGLQDMQQEFRQRRQAGEDPRAIAIDFKLRMQGRAQGPAAPGQNMFLGSPQQETPEPYPMGQGQRVNQMGGPVGGATTSLQRPPMMRDVASLGDLQDIASKQMAGQAAMSRAQGGMQDDAWREELARANLEARLRGLDLGAQRVQQGWGNLGMRGQEFGRRENLDYAKMAGEAPFVVPRLRTLIGQAPMRGPEAGDYIARRAADVLGGRLGGLVRIGADATLSQDERNFRREVAQVVQGYRRGEFGSQVTGLEMQVSDMLAGEQLSVDDTIAALQALEQLTSNRLSRAQATVPGAAARIESGTSAINRGGGPTISPLPSRQSSLPSLPSSAGSPGPGWVRQRNKTTGQERWFNPTTGESR